jgi:Holliday junction DNA helicase RuvB
MSLLPKSSLVTPTYNWPEALELILISVKKQTILPNEMIIADDGSKEIASRSRGTPRIALRLLKRIRDFAEMAGMNIIDASIASDSLNKLGVDEAGLDSNDYRYLRFINDHYAGGPVGVDTIAAALAEQRDSIEDTIEPYLIQIGFVQRTPRGRVLTQGALNHLG